MKDTADKDHRTQVDRAAEYSGKVWRNAQRLVFYRKILDDPIVKNLLTILDLMARRAKPRKSFSKIAEAYAAFFSSLITEAAGWQREPIGTPFQNHLLNLVLLDENSFSLLAQTHEFGIFGRSFTRQVELDLERLEALYHLNMDRILELLRISYPDEQWSDWHQLCLNTQIQSDKTSVTHRIKLSFHESAEWAPLAQQLAEHYQEAGCGIYAAFRAFVWKRHDSQGFVQPIADPDPIRFEQLVGCEDQKSSLIRNTHYFLSGYPSNNVFICGDRGTGKSSAIKALLNYFSTRALRMIEISRDDLSDLSVLLKEVRQRPYYFIVFVDDLSFEEGETQYKTLKAVLEGNLESKPPNVLVYATSNRRHVIREYFSDRGSSESDEIRHQDTLQEKVSLADRFGIQLVFVAPSQNEFLEIVCSMAERRKLAISQDDLKKKALLWVQFHNARSGRTARQFIDYLSAELAMDHTQDNTSLRVINSSKQASSTDSTS